MRSDAQASDVELLRLATSHQTVDNSNIHLTNGSYDRGHWTYRCCITGLCCSYIASIACAVLASGVLGYSENPKDGVYQWARMHTWPHINISPTLGEIVPLAVNVAATALIEATGLIHATTLRWALGRRLTFNSNLRLFASARGSFALGPVANAVHAGLLVLTYTSTSLLFPISPSPEFCEINPVGSVIAECDGLSLPLPPSDGLPGCRSLRTSGLGHLANNLDQSPNVVSISSRHCLGQRRARHAHQNSRSVYGKCA